MAVRTDLTVDWGQSPRLITVASPATEITIQDLVDTLRDLEDNLENLQYDQIISAAGKEELGGGVQVGITATLLNALLQFEARPGPTYVQCNVSGGNLVAVDDVGVTQTTPISPTAFTQVVVTASSSATTSSQAQLEYSTFNEGVTVDAINGTSGTTSFPAGTPGDPVDNIPEAIVIAEARGFSKIFIKGDITLDTGDIIDNYLILGENSNRTTITVNTGASTVNTEFGECTLTGILDGGSIVRKSVIGPLDYVDGIIIDSMINSSTTITLSGGGVAHFLNCFSGQPGTGTPTIDMNATGSALAMRGYNGGVFLTNLSGTDSVTIDLDSGQVKLDPDAVTGITNGTIVCRGDGKVIDADTDELIPSGTSTFNGGATIINETNYTINVETKSKANLAAALSA